MTDYTKLIEQAKKNESITSLNNESIKAGEMVNLCIRVPSKWRNHWKSEAAKQGIPLGDYILQAITAQYGEPPI